MLNIFLTLFLFLSTFLFQFASASECFPENSMRISKFDKETNGMTEEKFNSIVDEIGNLYSPIVKNKGGQLLMSKSWKEEVVNAAAMRYGSVWMVSIFGGLARHPLMTDDGLRLVICHELSHHLGGAPTKGGIRGYWASTEGQADYIGSMKCLRHVFEMEDKEKSASSKILEVDPVVLQKCSLIYTNEKEQALCARISMAAFGLSQLLNSLSKNPKVISFSTPDQSIVKKSNPDHPEAQCRLDTFFRGALCDKDFLNEVDHKDTKVGVCLKKDGLELGARPLCWYKPGRNE
jgi:hypothetical protein